MKIKKLIKLLETVDDNSVVRLSINGEAPLPVKALALADDNVVILAVPSWDFSEISDTLTQISALTVDEGQQAWDAVWRSSESGDMWICIAHGNKRDNCPECKRATGGGYHWGAKYKETRFCNCHCSRTCDEAGEDSYGKA